MEFITLHKHNPFTRPNNDLIDISSGVIETEAVNVDNAAEIG